MLKKVLFLLSVGLSFLYSLFLPSTSYFSLLITPILLFLAYLVIFCTTPTTQCNSHSLSNGFPKKWNT